MFDYVRHRASIGLQALFFTHRIAPCARRNSLTMAGNRTADELLKWGLRHAEPSGEQDRSSVAQVTDDIASGRRPDLADPGLYNAIMGKSEAQMMSEELAVATDRSRSESDRCTALDNFEMLVEQVDNANNMENMNMWPPILALLNEQSAPIQTVTLWIIGTAIQNNDKAQVLALSHGALPPILTLLESPEDEVRRKAMYALSALLRHYPHAVATFQDADGWAKLHTALLDPNMAQRRKVAFLLNQLLLQDPTKRGSASTPAAAPAPASTQRSSSTALMPVGNEPASDDSVLPSAPLEHGPATLRSNVKHPDVARALLDTGIFATLAASVLPPDALQATELPWSAEQAQRIQRYGDGSSLTYTDLDYSEKATQTVMTLLNKVGNAYPLPSGLLSSLGTYLASPPSADAGSARSVAEELSVDASALRAFLARK